jgi:type I restriction enzyme S subunit
MITPLKEIVSISTDSFRPSENSDRKVSLFSFAAFDGGKCPEEAEEREIKSNKTRIQNGDVLFAKLNPRIPRVWPIHDLADSETAVCSTEFVVLRPNKEEQTDPDYLAYMLEAPQFLAPIQRLVSSSTKSHQRVKPAQITEGSIPRRPLEEQRRIVARIQECLSRVEEMERLQAKVAEDAAAFYGLSVSRVIEELLEKHPSKPVGELLSSEREAMRSGPFGSAMKHDEFVPEGNLVIGIANVQANRFDPVRKWMITDEKYEEMARYEVAPGDVLITIMGTIGRTCVVPEEIGKAITSKHVYRIRFPKDKVVPEYVSFLINFDFGTKRQLFGSAAGGVMPGLNATKLRDLKICLPPIAVQQETVDKLNRAHGAIREMLQLDSRPELSALRNAILRQAFAGEL